MFEPEPATVAVAPGVETSVRLREVGGEGERMRPWEG